MTPGVPPWLTLLGVIPLLGGLVAIVGALLDLFVDRPHPRSNWRDLAFLVGCLIGLVIYLGLRL